MSNQTNSAVAIPSDERPYRLVSEMRDAAFRPLIISIADVLAKAESEGFRPIGNLRGRCEGPGLLAGRFGALCRVEGETGTERFGIAIPFADRLEGIDENGKRRFVAIDCFENMLVRPDGLVRVLPKVWLRNVRFRLITDLPFAWSELNFQLSLLLSQYSNESGLSETMLGRQLRTDYPDYIALAQINIRELAPVLHFVETHWDSSRSPPPTRETISATLAALSMRARVRGRHARK